MNKSAYIERINGNTRICTNRDLNNTEFLMMQYASKAFSCVLPDDGKFTFTQWAEEIKKSYDENEAHNHQVLAYILKLA
jgi:hypothetical protein